jgi:hypothetical protein
MTRRFKVLPLLLVLALPAGVQAQSQYLEYVTNNGFVFARQSDSC